MRVPESTLVRIALGLRQGDARLVLAVVAISGLSGCSKGKTKLDPKKASAELSTGLKAQAAGTLSDAAQHYNEALKYDPKNKFALYDLALIDAADSNYGEAANKYRAVLAIKDH